MGRSLIAKFRRAYFSLLALLRWPWRPVIAKKVKKLPTKFAPRTLYIVGDHSSQWHASMLCPGTCGQVLHMNLDAQDRPLWRVEKHEDGTPTLHPSVWRKVGCKAHFWLKAGRIIWVEKEVLRQIDPS